MWISRRDLHDIMDRLGELEKHVRDLDDSPRIYAGEGQIHAWSGAKFRLIDAVNQIAKHVGIRWEQQPEVASKLECLTEGKSEQR